MSDENGTDMALIEVTRGGELIARLHLDGTAEFGPAYSPDDAAREFWRALGTAFPGIKPLVAVDVPDYSADDDKPGSWRGLLTSSPAEPKEPT